LHPQVQLFQFIDRELEEDTIAGHIAKGGEKLLPRLYGEADEPVIAAPDYMIAR
jgi:hypothetical protein